MMPKDKDNYSICSETGHNMLMVFPSNNLFFRISLGKRVREVKGLVQGTLGRKRHQVCSPWETEWGVTMRRSFKCIMFTVGKLDIYPRFAPFIEWDAALLHATLVPLGAKVVDADNIPLIYNKENGLIPHFTVYA